MFCNRRCPYILFAGRVVSEWMTQYMLGNFISSFNEFCYFFGAPSFGEVNNYLVKTFFGFGSPDYFFSNLLYFFITSVCGFPKPFFDCSIPRSTPFLTSSGITSQSEMVSSAKVLTTESTVRFFLSDKYSR